MCLLYEDGLTGATSDSRVLKGNSKLRFTFIAITDLTRKAYWQTYISFSAP
jgi:hypothetical protein